jgi:two-component system phosphate regulon sensor histidine kinase PhoR
MLHQIRWRIAIPYILLIVLLMSSVAYYLSIEVRTNELTKLDLKASSDALLISNFIRSSEQVLSLNNNELDNITKEWSQILDARITVIDSEGIVIAESDADRFSMDNHLDRPEVQQAISEGIGKSVRYSRTEGTEFMYIAVPVYDGSQLAGFIRIAIPTQDIQAAYLSLIRPIIFATILAILVAIIIAALIAEYISRPIRELTAAVKQITVEDLDLTPILSSQDEFSQLTKSFEAVVEELQTQIRILEREQKKLEDVLQQLTDGVVIVDRDGIIQMINPAANEIFSIEGIDATGQSLATATRHHDIIHLWKQTQESREGEVKGIEITTSKLTLQALGIPLTDSLPGSSLLVFHDISRIRQLETIRRDFISNISHELRTPLASLKALSETLQNGALEDPRAANRFLSRMELEVDSLSLMVQELLELSRIESGKVPFQLEEVDPCDLLKDSIERLRLQAEQSGLTLSYTCPDGLPQISADPSRMKQVLVNLLHNAIKFTSQGGSINLSCEQQESKIIFSVTDSGVGIAANDIPRIFERFYKADRSRAGGGTGLGLAISKHIVDAHGGQIWVESVEGKGSIFSFNIPIVSS